MDTSPEAFENLRKTLAAPKLEHRALLRDCEALSLPGAEPVTLERDWEVTIVREVDGAFVVQAPVLGGEYRIDSADADALGKNARGDAALAAQGGAASGGSLHDRVREMLALVNDPELPVSIVDLGLVYTLDLAELSPGSFQAEIEMTLTTQACGMGAMISRDVKRVVGTLDEIASVEVRIVWEPAWTPHRITAQGRRKLGME